MAEDEDDGKKIRRAEERAEKALKSATTRKTTKQVSSVFRPSSSRFTPPSHRASSGFLACPIVSLVVNLVIGGPNVTGLLVQVPLKVILIVDD